MRFIEKELQLKDGTTCILRSPEKQDAQIMLDYLKLTSSETPFLSRYPEELTLTIENEEAFLQTTLESDTNIMIAAFINGELAGNVGLNCISTHIKLKHRIELGIAIKQQYWNNGLGHLLLAEAINQARSMGYQQIELGVFSKNTKAKSLYEKFGFAQWGVIKNGCQLKDGTCFDEIMMGLQLDEKEETMNHLGTQMIETKRLQLRPFTMEDVSAMYHNWANDDEVTKFLSWPTHSSIEVSEKVLKDWTSHYTDKEYYQWAIEVKGTDIGPIGSIGIVHKDDELKLATIGYCISRAFWHQGITSEALTGLIDFLFTQVHMNRIEAIHDVANPNSGNVMKKCGMQYEGTMRQADINNQGICDYSQYAILACDYKNK